jgi:hypothetical protein
MDGRYQISAVRRLPPAWWLMHGNQRPVSVRAVGIFQARNMLAHANGLLRSMQKTNNKGR